VGSGDRSARRPCDCGACWRGEDGDCGVRECAKDGRENLSESEIPHVSQRNMRHRRALSQGTFKPRPPARR
jgi:hypothetical protein